MVSTCSTNDSYGLTHLLEVQDGVISRRQLLELGAGQHDIDRMLRRRDLTRVQAGVYVNHTGPLTWVQRAWSAVLYYWPAALTQLSALPKPPEAAHIHVAVDVRRSVALVPGVQVHRKSGFGSKVDWLKSPPKIVAEEAALDAAAAAANDLAAIHVLADVCQSRITTPAKLRQALDGRRRLPRGVWLRRIIEDLAEGACSVLEHGYLTRSSADMVYRAATDRWAARQLGAGMARRDLSGLPDDRGTRRTALPRHRPTRDKDFDRDLDARVDEKSLTVRLTYGQVFGTPCRTAARIGQLLQRRGWSGSARQCPDCR